jgi:hypothetical protein
MRVAKKMSRHRWACATVSGLVAIAGSVITGSAATPMTPLPATAVQTFRLATESAVWTEYQAAIAAVQRSGAVEVVSTLTVAESGQHQGRPGLCHNTGLEPALTPSGFCWDPVDDKSNGYNETTGGWTPQGLTGSHDANNVDGTIDGRHVHLATWHWGNGAGKGNQFTRLSMVRSLPDSISYGHVLLVRPSGSSFTAVKNTHADGVVWYGNRVFVANGRELQVYDMRHIWRMTTIGEDIGVAGRTSSARGHQWAMPMIGRYWTGTGEQMPCSARTGSVPCLNSLSLDRTGTDALISAEYTSPSAGAGGRIIRWPLNARSALPRADDGTDIGKVTAVAAYSTPVLAMQGAATDGTTMYISGQCPDGTNPDLPADHPDAWSCIYHARPDTEPQVVTPAPRLTQNLSYSRFTGRLWGINERINTSQGVRVVFSIDVSP